MLLNIGLSSEFGILQTVITTALDSGTKIAKWKITGAMSLGKCVDGGIEVIQTHSLCDSRGQIRKGVVRKYPDNVSGRRS